MARQTARCRVSPAWFRMRPADGFAGGFLAAVVGWPDVACFCFDEIPGFRVWFAGLPAIAGAIWIAFPRETLERIAIPHRTAAQRRSKSARQHLVRRMAGVSSGAALGPWRWFVRYRGAGLAPIDTAHNTVLAILVEGGLFGLVLATAIVVVSMRWILALRGTLRIALMTLMAAWLTSARRHGGRKSDYLASAGNNCARPSASRRAARRIGA